MRTLWSACAVLCLLAGCNQPPSTAYLGGNTPTAAGGSARGLAMGADANGETCTQLPSEAANAVDIYCSAWQYPAARIRYKQAGSMTRPGRPA